MNKEFIPYEQALALKELGFNEKCAAHYLGEEDDDIEFKWLIYRNLSIDTNKCIQAPTFSQAFRWFRENHKIHCTIGIYNHSVITMDLGKPTQNTFVLDSPSYEQAELDSLKKLIEIAKNK